MTPRAAPHQLFRAQVYTIMQGLGPSCIRSLLQKGKLPLHMKSLLKLPKPYTSNPKTLNPSPSVSHLSLGSLGALLLRNLSMRSRHGLPPGTLGFLLRNIDDNTTLNSSFNFLFHYPNITPTYPVYNPVI